MFMFPLQNSARKELMANAVPADGPALLGARASAGTMMVSSRSNIMCHTGILNVKQSVGLRYRESIFMMCLLTCMVPITAIFIMHNKTL